MSGVTGGSAPAAIWKTFMTKAGSMLGNQPKPGAVPTDAEQDNRGELASCDVRACGAKYQSFDAGDCTYQPLRGGPRQRCEKSSARFRQTVSEASGADDDTGVGRCNIDACAATYSSFRT